jgi:hypothetical protein
MFLGVYFIASSVDQLPSVRLIEEDIAPATPIAIPTAPARISILGSVGTHSIRKIEFDHFLGSVNRQDNHVTN